MSKFRARYGRLVVLCSLFGCTLFAAASDVPAALVRNGTIVMPVNDNAGTILAIDPATGNRDVFSLWPNIGAGPRMRRPTSIVQLPDRDFLVAEAFVTHGLFRIDDETGNRTFVSGTGNGIQGDPNSIGSGPIDNPTSVLLSASNEIFVVNQGGFNNSSGFITQVNLATGNRTLISGLGVGSGPSFPFLGRGEFAADGRLLVTAGDSILAVNVANGARNVFSGPGAGSGTAFSQPYDIVRLPDGDMMVADVNFSAFPFVTSLFRVDGDTGNRTRIAQHLTNDQDFDYQALSLDKDGTLLNSPASQKVFDINPLNGSQLLVSGPTRGTGPPILNWGDMVVAVPEPEALTLVWLLAGAVACVRVRV